MTIFAPLIATTEQAIDKAAKAYGKGTLARKMDAARRGYIEWKLPLFHAERVFGAEATLSVFRRRPVDSSLEHSQPPILLSGPPTLFMSNCRTSL